MLWIIKTKLNSQVHNAFKNRIWSSWDLKIVGLLHSEHNIIKKRRAKILEENILIKFYFLI